MESYTLSSLPLAEKLEIRSTKSEMVRLALRQTQGPEQSRWTHHPEPCRMAISNDPNSNDQNGSWSLSDNSLSLEGEGRGEGGSARIHTPSPNLSPSRGRGDFGCGAASLLRYCLEHWNIGILNLFRISDFVLRICLKLTVCFGMTSCEPQGLLHPALEAL